MKNGALSPRLYGLSKTNNDNTFSAQLMKKLKTIKLVKNNLNVSFDDVFVLNIVPINGHLIIRNILYTMMYKLWYLLVAKITKLFKIM